MAHPCFFCGSECYCSGDWDDVIVSHTPSCCESCGCQEMFDEDCFDDEDWDDDEEEGDKQSGITLTKELFFDFVELIQSQPRMC